MKSTFVRLLTLVITTALAMGCAPKRLGRTPVAAAAARVAADAFDESCGVRALALALAGTPDQGWGHYPQMRLPDHPPLQSFPRLVTPAFAERCGQQGRWYVPVLFDASDETVRAPEGQRRVKGQPRFADADPLEQLTFWLEPSGSGGRPESLISLGGPGMAYRSLEQLRVQLPDALELRSADMAGAVFAIPRSTSAGPVASPGFYWLRIVPRYGGASGAANALLNAMLSGDLPRVLTRLESAPFELAQLADVEDGGLFDALRCHRAVPGIALITCAHPYKHFWPESYDVWKAIRRARKEDPKEQARIADRLRAVYEDSSPGAVVLDDASTESFSFLVGGDIQNSSDSTGLRRFLDLAALRLRPERGEEYEQALREELQLRQSELLFVLIAGDLADAEASSDMVKVLGNALGIWPPSSPYADEFPALVSEIRRSRVPVVAVPGNHDGYVGSHGIVNLLFSWHRAIDRINDAIPVLLKLPLPKYARPSPRYDGLAEWMYYMGATSYAFSLRGHTFHGLNSYNLDQRERTAVGAVVFNWGGGIQPEDTKWLQDSLDQLPRLAGNPRSLQFLYMHHDPRASTPLKTTLGVDRFGIYDPVDNRVSSWTMGHFGLGHSSCWDLYIPVLTPVVYFGSRFVDDFVSGRGRPQQEWMRRDRYWCSSADGPDYYSARPLTELIGDHLEPRGKRTSSLSHVFFAHNDVPLGDGRWVWENDGGVVFPELRGGNWREGRENHRSFKRPNLPIKWMVRPLVKLRNDEPPDWAKAQRPTGNATVVRLDDLSYPAADHGFHVVTISPIPSGGACDDTGELDSGQCVYTKWIGLPSDPER